MWLLLVTAVTITVQQPQMHMLKPRRDSIPPPAAAAANMHQKCRWNVSNIGVLHYIIKYIHPHDSPAQYNYHFKCKELVLWKGINRLSKKNIRENQQTILILRKLVQCFTYLVHHEYMMILWSQWHWCVTGESLPLTVKNMVVAMSESNNQKLWSDAQSTMMGWM